MSSIIHRVICPLFVEGNVSNSYIENVEYPDHNSIIFLIQVIYVVIFPV